MLRKLVPLAALIFVANISMAQEATTTDKIVTENYNDSTVDSTSNSTTKVESPPPSAISPSINTSNSDLCTVGVAGAVQTQILGISAGKTIRDMNCEKLKNAKTLYDMGMKVAAVSVMCQDERVFDAMMNAGTPCPYDGLIGDAAKAAWLANEEKKPDEGEKSWNPLENIDEDEKSTLFGGATVGGLLLLLLL
jgi:hypothetical protein|tara:strand:+ start:2201 stop:2779 length:579 start_codon:yes stop_codon:yes gene_type:complete